MEQIVEPQKFATWFKPVRPVSIVDSTLTVEVPSDFFREYLEATYLDVIKKTLKRVIGADAKLIYLVKIVKSQPAMAVPAAAGTAPVNREISVNIQPSGNPSPFVYPGLTKIKINPNLNPVYCFANFIVGECNKMGFAAGSAISAAPGKNSFNPLMIFGGPGLGKTHLAQAIGIAVHEKFPDLIVLYVNGHDFKTQFMDAVNVRNKLTDFLGYYKKIDVLIVDDIQGLQGKGTQSAFFNIFNHLHQTGKQLIFTSDRPPVDLQDFEDRLLSRFKWGVSVELMHPDYATRLQMLQSLCRREGVTIGQDVLEYLASRIKTNFRELEGAFLSVMAYATAMHAENSVELAAKVTEKIVSSPSRELNIPAVQAAVCDYFNISTEELVSKSRKRQIVQARQISMYLCRNLISNCSLSTIGAETGGKDHATVLHSCNMVADLMSTDRVFKKYVTDLESKLSPAEN
ncbi:MAG: chromosomal replication initiator protein DnaA [Bacteroidales bacterium]|nr:chromosomal replication initiator protein DnaA [Bacteroidales bacterium]MBR0292770.1 chromosomal replication initiator protein DnaA [Bacteroidales bacterium]